MDETYARWDQYIHHVMINIVDLEKNHQYLILGDLDPKDPCDLFFFRISHISNSLVNGCTIYGYISNIFKRFIFKIKEPKFHMLPYSVLAQIPNDNILILDKTKRLQLLTKLAEQHEISLDEIKLMYQEYYAK